MIRVKKDNKVNVIDFTQVLDLRKVAEALKGDLPHLPLLLELVIIGMGRRSIANLTLDDIHGNKIHWQNRKNVKIVTNLGPRQLEILEEYLSWRKSRSVKNNKLLLVKKSSSLKDDSYYLPIKHERVRSDIRFMGREIGLSFGLEIPAIHEAVSSHLISNKIDANIIRKQYKLY